MHLQIIKSSYRDAEIPNPIWRKLLTQRYFNIALWRQLNIQKNSGHERCDLPNKSVKLILDTATACFDVLRAIDSLSFIERKKTSLPSLDQTTQRLT